MSVTIERYLKVVHPALAKKLLLNWVKVSVVAFAWISSIAYGLALVFSTSAVIDGGCYVRLMWKSQLAAVMYSVWYFVSFFVLAVFIFVFCYTLGGVCYDWEFWKCRVAVITRGVWNSVTFSVSVFVFCYWHILVVIRRQARVMAAHSAAGPSTAAQPQSNQIQSNIIKTMITVSAFYVVAWLPINLYYVILSLSPNVKFYQPAHYILLFIHFLYICANPFIYATKFDPVKRVLVGLIPCKRHSPQQAGGNVEMTGTSLSVQRRK